jgi:hypothetical protein
MNESDLRALVRAAIARQIDSSAATSPPRALAPSHLQGPVAHPSHMLFVLPTGSDAGGPCIIEPEVMCNHCGYCKSYGH